MNKLNKVYISNIYKNNIHKSYTHYSLEDAIQCGLSYISDEFYDIYNRSPYNNQELEDFINNNFEDDCILINVISGNRIRFNTSKELINYFFDNINKISNENLYDFLLSFVECDNLFYDYKGNLLNSEISTQCPVEEYGWDAHVIFTEDSCKEGKYRFSYNDIGIDTLYNASWIKPLER